MKWSIRSIQHFNLSLWKSGNLDSTSTTRKRYIMFFTWHKEAMTYTFVKKCLPLSGSGLTHLSHPSISIWDLYSWCVMSLCGTQTSTVVSIAHRRRGMRNTNSFWISLHCFTFPFYFQFTSGETNMFICCVYIQRN